MSLLSLPAGVRLQIWHRHLALRGRPNVCHGNTRPRNTGATSLRRYTVFTGDSPQSDGAAGKNESPLDQSIGEAMPKETPPISTTQATSQTPQAGIDSLRESMRRAEHSWDGAVSERPSILQKTLTGPKRPKSVRVPGFGTQRLAPAKTQGKGRPNNRRKVVHGTLPSPQSLPPGAVFEDGPFDLAYLLEHSNVVTKDDYPHAPVRLFSPEESEQVIREACKRKFDVDVPPVVRKVYRTSDARHGWERKLEIPSLTTISAVGEDEGPQLAKRTATAHLLAKLHSQGILQALFNGSSAEPTPASNQPSSDESRMDPKIPTTLDAEESFTSIVSPLHERYQNVHPALFDPSTVARSASQLLQKYDTICSIEGQTQASSFGSLALVTYELRVELPGHVRMTSTGAARNKVSARQLAWGHMLRELDGFGLLQQLLSPVKGRKGESKPLQAIAEEEEPLDGQSLELGDLVTVDEQTMEAEKDAKIEIYNWAASIGMIPQFAARVVSRRRPGSRKQSKSSRSKSVEASIKLSGIGIHVIRVGPTLRAAETAAAVAFKQAAEAKQSAGDCMIAPSDWKALTVDTAAKFLDFYRSINQGMYLEVEAKECSVAMMTQNHAQITINDQPIGEPAVMATKSLAGQVARLNAAVHLVQADQQLIHKFAVVVRDDKRKVLREIRPMKASINGRTLDIMRSGLLEARSAGLSDNRHSLLAETAALEEDNIRRKRALPDSLRQEISERLLGALWRVDQSTPGVCEPRDALPMSQHRKQVLDLVSGSLYSVIVGATGSGKTTQVPQIILEDAIQRGHGGYCDIVCTQPRRLAAISVANRVATERGQPPGEHVGHHVRFDCQTPEMGGSITYCTTGILLEQLKYDADGVFDTVSHIVIDEVHERSLPIDFLMVLLKRAIKERQAAGKSVPKVILMSATLDPDLFAKYFAQEEGARIIPAPTLSVPGRTFPVHEKYVEEILSELSPLERTQLDAMSELDKGATKDYLETELAFANSQSSTTAPVIDWKREVKEEQSDGDRAAAQEKEDALVPVSLVAATIAHISNKNEDGAILAFLPGLPEIIAVRDLLANSKGLGLDFENPEKFKICQLHSALPPQEQTGVLEPVPKGCRKIILSTTIAETSVTVPDVKFVVDSGKLRQQRYDQSRRITQLITTWESSSNARQRAGRAGRVQEGHYYALFTRPRRQAMPASPLPELLLSDLQETCLSVKAQGFKESVHTFLREAIEPPSEKAVVGAIENLKAIEALTQDEDLTALGRTLSKLPVHPSLGKMILLGIVFRCLDPMIVLSSLDKDRPLFVSPPGKRAEAKAALQRYHKHGSDQLAFYEAFKVLREMRAQTGIRSVEAYAWPNFLHFGCFKSMAATAESIEKILIQCGLVPQSAAMIRERHQLGGDALNRHSGNPALIKSLFLAGVQPNLAAKNAGKGRAHRTVSEEGVMIHPSSLNYTRGKKVSEDEEFLYSYESLRKTIDGKSMFMKDTTLVTPLTTLLFGGNLQMQGSKLTMDEWLTFRIESLEDSAFATRLVLEFRKALDRMLNGAFNSLSGSRDGATIADDPIREGLVKATVGVLEQADESVKKREAGAWVPESWKTAGTTRQPGVQAT